MSNEAKVAAFEGGELRILDSESKSREATLALPLSRLIVKMLRISAGEDPVEVATPIIKAMCPFPDDPLAVSCERVREDAEGTIVIAAALPESSAEDIAEALDKAKLNVVKIDALAIGELRGLWPKIEGDGRRLVLIRSVDCLTMIVLDDREPSAIRAITDLTELRRETTLSLLEAEDFGGARPLKEIIFVSKVDENTELSPLEAFGAPIRRLTLDADAGLKGAAERAAEAGTLDALPDSWRAVLEETRFKAKLVKNLAIALGGWILAMTILFGVPIVYGFMTDHMKELCRQHDREYKAVAEKKAKVKLVQRYSDHARGALEIMKAVSDRLPEGITLSSWDFKRDDSLRLKGDADASSEVYKFKDALSEMGVFDVVKLGALSSQKDGKQKFDLECKYEEAAE